MFRTSTCKIGGDTVQLKDECLLSTLFCDEAGQVEVF